MLSPLDEYGQPAYAHAACFGPSFPSTAGAAMVPGEDGVLACQRCGYREDVPATGLLADGFDLTHRQWGLRGDPYLWTALRDRLSPLPTPDGDLLARLYDELVAAADVDLRTEREDVVVRGGFAHGGMSSGMLDLGWWRDRGLPLVVDRARRS